MSWVPLEGQPHFFAKHVLGILELFSSSFDVFCFEQGRPFLPKVMKHLETLQKSSISVIPVVSE